MSLRNVSGVVRRLSTHTITLTRRGVDDYDDHGVLVRGATSTIPVRASVQPARGRDLQKLPEGSRTAGAVAVYAPAELRLLDVFEANGVTYEIQTAEPWAEVGGYWVGVAVEASNAS